ncbi:hypothetical protein [Escherichia coli]
MERFNVLTSPHVNKDARDQYEIRNVHYSRGIDHDLGDYHCL